MAPGRVDRLRSRFKHRQVLKSALGFMGRHHLEIVPYHVTLESLKEETRPQLDPGLGPVTFSPLTPPEIEAVYALPDSATMAYEKTSLLEEGCLCFGLKVGGEIAAFMWCNPHRCHSRLNRFPMKEDEAYLCGAVTLKAHRGRNLAPVLRYELYRYLNGTGRSSFYSITEYFNTPAWKFKEKLGARHLRLHLHVRLGSRYEKDMVLRRYRGQIMT